jgi:hypothetical protein
MALFSFFVKCGPETSFVTQVEANAPYEAVREFLRTPVLKAYLEKLDGWPLDYSIRDTYMFIPLEGLTNAYFCGLGARGKYVEINLFQTAQRSSAEQKYCGPVRRLVNLR